ncbi:MAG: hypothetical protein M3R72_05795, partial [Bacteroidota bacterium]|nr:hypothetical protein [Bacteroidota bacterium]
AFLSGSPMLNNNWGTGSVAFTNGKQLSNLPLQFNVQKNELYFKRDSTVFGFADKVGAFTMTYQDDGGTQQEVYFKSGYPDNRGKATSFLYQVINDGPNAQFLEGLESNIDQHYVYGAAAKENYVVTAKWYIYNVKKNILFSISRNKRSVEKALSEYKEEIEKYAVDNNVSFNSEKEINQLITSLNKVK